MLELDDQQRAAALAPGSSVWISAGPGAGKTRILAGRCSHLLVDLEVSGHQVAALTYTRSMATDLRRRILAALPEQIPCAACGGQGTIGSFTCSTCMGQKGVAPVAPDVGTLHSLAAGWVRRALKNELAGCDYITELRWVSSASFGIAQPEDVDDLIDVAYHELRKKVTKRDLRAGLRVRGPDLCPFTEKTEARRQLSIRGLVTFSDLLVMLQRAVEAPRRRGGPPHLADVVTHMLLDEAQDFSPLHWAIIDAWAPAGLTVAGDDAQSIYSFMHDETRAEYPSVPLFQARLAAAPVRFDVGRNYRSAASVVTDCRRVRSQIAADGACSDLDLQAVRADQPCAVVIEHDDGDDAACAASHVQGLIDGGSHMAAAARTFAHEEIAVLARTWAELEAVGTALDAIGIPYAIPERGRDRWRSLAGRAVVALARAADRGMLDDHDARIVVRALGHAEPGMLVSGAMSLATIQRRPLAQVLDESPVARAGLPAKWWSDVLEMKTTVALASHIEEAGVIAGRPLVDAARAMTTWQPVVGTGEEDEPVPATPGEWLCWLASDESNCNIQMKPGHVVLSTIHGFKGLESPAVIVVGASEGSLPGPYDKNPGNVAEAGRVLYVAMTRARDVLRVLCPTNLRGKPRRPSRWLVAAGLIDAPADAG